MTDGWIDGQMDWWWIDGQMDWWWLMDGWIGGG
jgi:hypothetical protein